MQGMMTFVRVLPPDEYDRVMEKIRQGGTGMEGMPGMKHPSPMSTMWRFFKTFKFLAVPIAVITYCFGW